MTQSTVEWLTLIGDVKAWIICIDYTRQEPKKGEVVQIVSWCFRFLAGCFVWSCVLVEKVILLLGSMMFHLANDVESIINIAFGMVYITHLWSYYVILRMVYGIGLTTLPLMDSDPRLMIRCTRWWGKCTALSECIGEQKRLSNLDRL